MENKNIKEFCVSCQKKITDQSEKKYTQRGNYCERCNIKCKKILYPKIEITEINRNYDINLLPIGQDKRPYFDIEKFLEKRKLQEEINYYNERYPIQNI